MVLKKKLYKKHDFDKQNFCLVRFEINFFTTRQILRQLFSHASDLDLNILQILSVFLLQFGKFSCFHHKRSRFRNVLGFGVGSVSQVILLE